jgi:hypothetical protein
MSAPSANRGYKRSWKNLLINKRYQLRFTLFMAGLAAVLITALGYYVMQKADHTTAIGINRVISEPCQEVPPLVPGDATNGAGAGAATDDTDTATPTEVDEPDTDTTGEGSAAGTQAKPTVVIDEMQTCDDPDPSKRPEDCKDIVPAPAPPPPPPAPVVAPNFVDSAVGKWGCELRHDAAVASLHRGRLQILLVLVGAGLLLVLGLAVYGIKMTHKVAGPLYKVTLYLAKMKDGRYDKVWNLRKGDQLVEFYEHFKAAHAGVVTMEQADIAQLKAVLAVVDKDLEKWSAPELAEKVTELRAMLARKEKSVE